MKTVRLFIKTICLAAAVIGVSHEASAQTSIQQGMHYTDSPLAQLMQLQPYKYESATAGEQYGLFVDEVEGLFPGSVRTQQYRYYSGKNSSSVAVMKEIDLEKLVPVLVASLQEQQMQLETLKAELASLKQQKEK